MVPRRPNPSFLSSRDSPEPGMLTGCEVWRKPALARPWEMLLPEQFLLLSPASRPEQLRDLAVVSEKPLDLRDLLTPSLYRSVMLRSSRAPPETRNHHFYKLHHFFEGIVPLILIAFEGNTPIISSNS